jgi:hypothetical protein
MKENLLDLKNQTQNFQKIYKNKLESAKNNLTKIKKGYKFGYNDNLSYWDSYFPLTLLKIIDEENCLIQVIEKGNPNSKEEIIDTYDLFISNEM